MNEIYIALIIFLIIVFFSFLIKGERENFFGIRRRRRRRRKRNRRRRADWRRGWWDKKHYLINGANIGRRDLELPRGHRENYDANSNANIRHYHYNAGHCGPDRTYRPCAEKNNHLYVYRIMHGHRFDNVNLHGRGIFWDARQKFNKRRENYRKELRDQTLKELAANNPDQTNYEMAPFFPDITNSNKKLNETIRRIIYHDHLYYQEAKDAVVRHKMGDFPSLKEMTQNAYIQNQKQIRKKTLVDSGIISGFTSGIRYKDPNNRGTFDTESAVWNKVKNEITSVAGIRDKFNKIESDIVDDKKNITRSYNNFLSAYQWSYNMESLPIEQQLESSEREKARIQAATYPSRDIIVTDGMSNMMKEGMSIIDKEKRKDKKCIKATCKYESSSYPNIYK